MAEYVNHAKRTRVLICRTLSELLDEKPFSKITVQDIISRAQIQRSTFYRYFRDKYDVAETINQNLAEMLTKYSLDISYGGASIDQKLHDKFFRDYRKVLLQMMRLRDENIDLPQHLLAAFRSGYKNRFPDATEFEAYLAGQNFVATSTWLTGKDYTAEEIQQFLLSGDQLRWFARSKNVSPAELTAALDSIKARQSAAV